MFQVVAETHVGVELGVPGRVVGELTVVRVVKYHQQGVVTAVVVCVHVGQGVTGIHQYLADKQ